MVLKLLAKKMLSKKAHGLFKSIYVNYANKYNFWRLRSVRNQKLIYLLGTPEHDNLGDHAIAYAEHQFFQDNFPDYKIVEIPTYNFQYYSSALMKIKKNEDIVAFNGGGNFGDVYMGEEELRRAAVKVFKDNKIILFPQTIYFSDSERGKSEFLISKEIYSNHKNLTIVAREEFSYKILKENFPSNKILLTPDIVFYLNKTNLATARRGALICLRQDVERVIPLEKHEHIKEFLSQIYDTITVTDTVTYNDIPLHKRDEELQKKWMQFRSAEIVITDRLHGMVFAAITGTPCIVLSNYNYKVKGTYEWIRHLDHIIFEEDVNKIEEHIERLRGITAPKYDSSFASKYYQTINDDIRQK